MSIYIGIKKYETKLKSLIHVLKNSDRNTMLFYSGQTDISGYEFIKMIPVNLRTAPSTLQNLSIIEAAYKNKIDLLQILLQDLTLKPNFFQNLALITAASFGFESILKLLVMNSKTNISDQSDAAIKSAIINGHIHIVEFLFSIYTPNKNSIYHMCHLSIDYMRFDILKLIIYIRPDINFTIKNNYLLYAVVQIHLESSANDFMDFIWSKTKIDLAADNNQLLVKAVEYGQIQMVRSFLSDTTINLAAKLSKALVKAIETKNIPMIKLLLRDPRTDPAADHNIAIITASQKNYQITELLLADPRTDPSDCSNLAVKSAVSANCILTLELLLNDTRITYLSADLVKCASMKKKTYMLKLILADPRMTDTIPSETLKFAHSKEIMKIIMGNPRYDSSSNGKVLIYAIQKLKSELFQLLLSDSRTDPTIRDNYALGLVSFDIRTYWNLSRTKLSDRNITFLSMLLGHRMIDPSIVLSDLRDQVSSLEDDGEKKFQQIKLDLVKTELDKRHFIKILMLMKFTGSGPFCDVIQNIIQPIYVNMHLRML